MTKEEKKFDEPVALSFLEFLFADCPAEEWVSLFAVDRVHPGLASKVLWAPVHRLNLLVLQARPLVPSCCLWVGVATRKAQLKHRRGNVEDCVHLPALFVDLDITGAQHKARTYPPSMEAAEQMMAEFPAPDMKVSTGGGLHAYWKVQPPYEAELGAQRLEEWGNKWQAVSDQYGWKVDWVFNLDRVLRLPGSFNMKDPAVPIPVTILGS